MTLEELTDILVANNFGRRAADFYNKEYFKSDLVMIGENEVDQTFYLYARTKPSEKVLKKLFENNPDIIVSFVGKIIAA